MKLEKLKPSYCDVRMIAIRETSVEHYLSFQPICLGKIGNGVALIVVSFFAAPFVLLKILGCIATGAFWRD